MGAVRSGRRSRCRGPHLWLPSYGEGSVLALPPRARLWEGETAEEWDRAKGRAPRSVP